MSFPSPPLDVLCIGHAAWDLVFTINGFVEEDHKYRARALMQTGGGPAANAATLLSRWGMRTALAGHAGQDTWGELLRQELDEAGVDTSHFVLSDSEPTPISCVLANRINGSRTLINHRGEACWPLSPEQLPSVAPRAVLCDGHEPTLTRAALRRFPESLSVLDGGSYRDTTHELASTVDHAIVSRAFATKASGIEPVDVDSALTCLQDLARRYKARMAITLGELGVAALDDVGHPIFICAPKVAAIDSTAAGDIFHGAFVWALLGDFDYRGAIAVAMRAAAVSVTRAGGRTSIPTREEALKFAPAWEGTGHHREGSSG